jgi:dihydroorotase
MYCLPILKREKHRQALRRAATSGHKCFFLGTDSAPHPRHLKECACGCAGVFSAPVAVAAYLQVFDEEGALDKFEAFSSLNGAAFYGIAPNKQKVTYVRKEVAQPNRWEVSGGDEIVSLFAGENVQWARV